MGGRIHVTHILAPAHVGGLERVVQGLARGHAGRGERVTVIAVLEHGQSCQFAEELGGAVEMTVIRAGARAYLKERSLIRAALRAGRPDVVHTHGFRPDVIGGSAARSLGIPVVSTVHGFTGGGWRIELYERLQCRALGSADAVVAVASDTARRLIERGVPAERIQVIPNGWTGHDTPPLERSEARVALGLPRDATVVGWVGRMSSEKAPLLLVRAVERMTDDHRPLVIFIGDGPERATCERAVALAGLGDSVRFVGNVQRAARVFRAFDVFCLTSDTEGTPIALLEAMAAGVPIVATAVGGVPDILSDESAWLVEPRDADALARAVTEALERRAEADERARVAAATLDARFSNQAWLDAYQVLYRQVLARSSR